MNSLHTISDKKYVTQSYELINARLDLSSVALNVFYAIASQIDINDEDLHKYEFSRSELEETLGTKIEYKYLKSMAKDLMQPFLIEDRNEKSFKTRNLFASFDYENNIITAQINPLMKDHFIGLKQNFVSAKFLGSVSKIKNMYAKKMYFKLKQRLLLKKYTFDLAELQESLVIPKSLKTFGNFKKRVLNQTVEEINKYTDLTVSYNVIKKGHSVVAVEFFIDSNKEFIAAENERKSKLKKDFNSKKADSKSKENDNNKGGVNAVEDWLNN